jgi:hypothetical protein
LIGEEPHARGLLPDRLAFLLVPALILFDFYWAASRSRGAAHTLARLLHGNGAAAFFVGLVVGILFMPLLLLSALGIFRAGREAGLTTALVLVLSVAGNLLVVPFFLAVFEKSGAASLNSADYHALSVAQNGSYVGIFGGLFLTVMIRTNMAYRMFGPQSRR